jgi:adenylate kinase
MNILIIGPQGSGKGTQARILIEKFNFYYFESGAYLRKMAESHPELKKLLNEGKLVPDKEFTSYLAAYLDNQNIYDNILFDGFPRTVFQYEFFKNWLKDKEVSLDLIIVLQISEAETLRRLTARRQDPASGKIYNLVTEPPPAEVDASKLIQRDDDKPEAIKKRLELYKEQTEPLVARLKEESEVIEVDGERPVKTIATELIKLVEERMNR